MIIKVEQRHIDKGQVMSMCFCPVALALKEQMDGTKSASVGYHGIIRYHQEDQRIRTVWNTPPAVKDFIQRFDRRQPVEPFEFELPDGERSYE